MKYFFIFIIILPLVVCFNHNYYLARELGNPLKFLGKCLQDKECKPIEYCEHQGINPIGSCKIGKESNQTCVFDRHCKSKICHHLKCRLKKPVKDGPCSGKGAEMHLECIETQYCHHVNKDVYKCADRKCHGLCIKDAHCLTNKCHLLQCKRPEKGC